MWLLGSASGEGFYPQIHNVDGVLIIRHMTVWLSEQVNLFTAVDF